MAFFLPLLLLTRTCPARLVNVTIDDGDGDPRTGLKPQYTKDWFTLRESKDLVNGWNVDTTQIYGHSLTSTFSNPANITLTFNGTNIWTYYAINTRFGTTVLFYLDDDQTPAGNVLEGKSSDVNTWKYDQLLFASKTLTQATHTLTMVITSSAQFFDYAIYSTDDGEVDAADPLPGTSSSAGSSPSTASLTLLKRRGAEKLAEIIVPVVGGAALVAAFCSWSLFRRRRRRRAQDHTTAWQEPEGMYDPAADTAALARADACAEKAITPYLAQPQLHEKTDTTVPKQRLMHDALRPKESDDAGGRIAPLPLPDLNASPGPDNGRPRTGPKRRAILEMMLALDPLRPASHVDEARGESTAEIRAELERLRAEAEEARAENEMLRQAVEPPPYSDGGRSERGSVLVHGGQL